MATHCSILAWKIPWTEEPEGPHILPQLPEAAGIPYNDLEWDLPSKEILRLFLPDGKAKSSSHLASAKPENHWPFLGQPETGNAFCPWEVHILERFHELTGKIRDTKK